MLKKVGLPLSGIVFVWFISGFQVVYAQEFGMNKVLYENFAFKVSKTEHFDIYHYPEEDRGLRTAIPVLERWFFRFSSFFGYSPTDRQPVILYAGHSDFQQTNVLPGIISQGIGGVTESERNRMIIPLTGVNAENDHVLGHELVHAFQFSRLTDSMGSGGTGPLWFSEGLAEYLSLGNTSVLTSMWLRDAVLNDDLPSIFAMEFNPSDYNPYRFGHALWAYIAGRWNDARASEFYRESFARGIEAAAEMVLGISLQNLERDWKESVISRITEQMRVRTFQDPPGVPVVEETRDMNIGPVVSDDGRFLAFFSRRNPFELGLVILETQTKKVVRQISNTGTGGRFDDLSFMNSAGAFSPDSSKFAFIVFVDGNNGISIIDIDTGAEERLLKFPSVQSILHVAWSPDGRRLAFSGISGGVSNLFLYDLETGELAGLTDDEYADLQPDWSPDGRFLVFSTDRGRDSAPLSGVYNPLSLASLEVETGAVRMLRLSRTADLINPAVAPDGRSVYFIASLDGFPDIYRYYPETGRLFRITRTRTGVSGLTELSAAMSLSRDTGDLYFNVFRRRGYAIDMLTAREPVPDSEMPATAETASGSGLFDSDTGISRLPPGVSNTGIVAEYLENPRFGLPDPGSYKKEDYTPVLSLSRIGNIGLGIAFGGDGPVFYGNVSLLFEDFLKNHLLLTAFSLSGTFPKDFAAQGAYLNQEQRLNWGLSLSHIPYTTAYYSYRDLPPGPDGSAIREYLETTERMYEDTAAFLALYPLSRNIRLETSAGVSRIGFEFSREKIIVTNGTITSRVPAEIATPDPLYLFRPVLSLVGDFSSVGFTSPVNGFRFRFDAAPSFGSLNYLSVNADYRQYFYTRPVNFGFRLHHTGRYLGDSESELISPVFLGNPALVRGYESGTFTTSECYSADGSGCTPFERLFGTRSAVFNAEVRIPLVGNGELGFINFPYLPLTLAGFFDAGIVWSRGVVPSMENAVMSAGGAVFINVLGAFVVQIYYAYPFQRPELGVHWGFSLGAGF